MLSGRLVHLIESHHKEIGERTLRQILHSPDLPHLQRLPESELRERSRAILEHLGEWLSGKEKELEIAKIQEMLGKRRFEQSVPLHEAVHALCLVKNDMIDFIEEQEFQRDCLGLYAEEELEHRIGRFFDALTIHLVRGYEVAWQKGARAAA
jgi:hypothetical protein